jgi:hypothetical protein
MGGLAGGKKVGNADFLVHIKKRDPIDRNKTDNKYFSINLIVSWIGAAASSITCSQSLCRYDNNYLMCVVVRIVYFVKYGVTRWHNCFATHSRD